MYHSLIEVSLVVPLPYLSIVDMSKCFVTCSYTCGSCYLSKLKDRQNKKIFWYSNIHTGNVLKKKFEEGYSRNLFCALN
jgi:hypothetical protein